MTMLSGKFFFGLRTSSPVEAIASKPNNSSVRYVQFSYFIRDKALIAEKKAITYVGVEALGCTFYDTAKSVGQKAACAASR
jgi:hypothetical protein